MKMGIENYHIVICRQCNRPFELRYLEDRDDYYAKYEDELCPSCRLDRLAHEGIAKFAFLKDATIVGYSLEDISVNPELRYIEVRLANGDFLKIDTKNTRWLHS